MAAIKNLNELLRSMRPELKKGTFVFCTITEKQLIKLSIIPVLVFREDEGVTIIIEQDVADKHSLQYSGLWALITLTVHSDLNAVGFLAAITKKLAEHEISVNTVSAYYHDHLFVLQEKAQQALQLLKEFYSTPK